MKSNHINTAARFTGLLAALLLLGGAVGIARADGAKGGATLLMRPTAPISPPSDSKPMSCGMCKDEVIQVRDTDSKGGARALLAGAPLTKAVARHGCSGCGTDWAIIGHGKAKRDVATHKCTSCGAELASCCSTSTSGVAATKGMEKTFEIAPVK